MNKRSRYFQMMVSIWPLFVLACYCLSASALELWSDPDTGQSVTLDTTLKLTGLGVYNPDDDFLYPKRFSATGLTRGRLDLEANLSERVTAELAYEHRANVQNQAAGIGFGGGALSAFSTPPWRIEALDWQVLRHDDTFSWRHEIDRAQVTIRPDWGTVTIGRQAIGYGRSVMFSAVDVFAPFSPAEVDREWRRGVDAVRVEYQTSSLSSLDVTSVVGRSWDDSALLGRFRGYVGDIDGELIAGKRGRDAMFAATMSAVLGEAAVHGEAALFHTPEKWPDSGLFKDKHWVGKLVLGASYTFDIGNGLTMFGEYHYSGFGLKDVSDIIQRTRSPEYTKRLLRGDSQILGQHALGVQASYPINDVLSGGLLLLESLTDGSGLVSPSLIWTASETATLTVHAFLPWGATPQNTTIRSEYGTSGESLFVQLSLYF